MEAKITGSHDPDQTARGLDLEAEIGQRTCFYRVSSGTVLELT
jgi:hypothetical protein